MPPRKKSASIPKERLQTVRQEITDHLKERPHTIADLSKTVGKAEKEIVEQLSHIQKTGTLRIDPAECIACGFEFTERERLKKPGRCPKCKSNRISTPSFSIES